MKNFAILETETSNKKIIEELEQFVNLHVFSKPIESVTYYLQVLDDRVQLIKISKSEIIGPVWVDFLSPKWMFKLKTLSKNQPLFKSIGSSKNIFDLTAGLGEDTFCFLSKGFKVTAFEKNPIVYSLLKNGFDRLRNNNKWAPIIEQNLKLIYADSLEFIVKTNERPEAIYIDPMYSEVGEALPKKEMVILREILASDNNIENLLQTSLRVATKRVVIKRSLKSKYLSLAPTHSFAGSTTRYDMYSVT